MTRKEKLCPIQATVTEVRNICPEWSSWTALSSTSFRNSSKKQTCYIMYLIKQTLCCLSRAFTSAKKTKSFKYSCSRRFHCLISCTRVTTSLCRVLRNCSLPRRSQRPYSRSRTWTLVARCSPLTLTCQAKTSLWTLETWKCRLVTLGCLR